MSDTDNTIDVGGHTAKEWALFLLLGAVIFVMAMVGIAFAMAVMNPESEVLLTGSIDLTLLMGILIGIATAAILFVGQQLNSNQMSAATRQADEAWEKEASNASTKNP